jgi:hypothetical protein
MVSCHTWCWWRDEILSSARFESCWACSCAFDWLPLLRSRRTPDPARAAEAASRPDRRPATNNDAGEGAQPDAGTSLHQRVPDGVRARATLALAPPLGAPPRCTVPRASTAAITRQTTLHRNRQIGTPSSTDLVHACFGCAENSFKHRPTTRTPVLDSERCRLVFHLDFTTSACREAEAADGMGTALRHPALSDWTRSTYSEGQSNLRCASSKLNSSTRRHIRARRSHQIHR